MSSLARAGQVARRYAGAARRRIAACARLEYPAERVLCLFCGKSHAWRDAGPRLYRHGPVFRAGTDSSDATVRRIAGSSRRVIPLAVGALIRAPDRRVIQPPETIDLFATLTARVPTSLIVGT